MSVFQEKAASVADGLVTTHKMMAGDVRTSPFLDFLAQLLQQLMPMLLKCLVPMAKAPDVHASLQNLSLIQRVRMLGHIRHQLAMQAAVDQYARPVHAEVLKMLQSTTVEETQQAMDEVASM